MKRLLSRVLPLVLIACFLFAFASCALKSGTKSTGSATTAPAGATTVTPGTGEDTAAPVGTTGEEEGLPIGEDTDEGWGPLHPF